MARTRSVMWMGAAALSLISGLAPGLVAPGAARADFSETYCAGDAAAPWVNGYAAPAPWGYLNDECTASSGYQFQLPYQSIPAGQTFGAGFAIPAGEVLTRVSGSFSSLSTTSGSAYLRFTHDNGVQLFSRPIGDPTAGTSFAASVPNGTDFEMSVICTSSTTCNFPGQNAVTVGPLTFTLHDTGIPAVQPAGGTLIAGGARRGEQSLGYTATAGGSGVASISVSLGTTVVDTIPVACQSPALQPCPASTSGVAQIDTDAVPDGIYPVQLTATNASGDPATVAVGTVRVRNHSGTQTLLTAAPRRVRTKLVIGWNWASRRHTVLTSLKVVRLRRGTIMFRCAGRGCPFTRLRADRRSLRRLVRHLVGSRFRPGDRLKVEIRAPHRRALRAWLLIRRGREPRRLRR